MENVGWIGGGCAQPVVIKEALKALADGKPRLVRISPTAVPEDGILDYTMTCHVKAAKRGEALDPLAPSWKLHLALLHYYLRNYAAAEEEYRQLTRSNPDLPGPHLGLYDIYSRTGKEADAIKELQQGLALQGATELAAALPSKYASSGFPAAKEFATREQIRILTEASKHDYISPIALATNYAVLDEKDNAFEWLEKAYEERAPGLLDLDLDPDYDNLRNDKRFDDLKRRIKAFSPLL